MPPKTSFHHQLAGLRTTETPPSPPPRTILRRPHEDPPRSRPRHRVSFADQPNGRSRSQSCKRRDLLPSQPAEPSFPKPQHRSPRPHRSPPHPEQSRVSVLLVVAHGTARREHHHRNERESRHRHSCRHAHHHAHHHVAQQ